MDFIREVIARVVFLTVRMHTYSRASRLAASFTTELTAPSYITSTTLGSLAERRMTTGLRGAGRRRARITRRILLSLSSRSRARFERLGVAPPSSSHGLACPLWVRRRAERSNTGERSQDRAPQQFARDALLQRFPRSSFFLPLRIGTGCDGARAARHPAPPIELWHFVIRCAGGSSTKICTAQTQLRHELLLSAVVCVPIRHYGRK